MVAWGNSRGTTATETLKAKRYNLNGDNLYSSFSKDTWKQEHNRTKEHVGDAPVHVGNCTRDDKEINRLSWGCVTHRLLVHSQLTRCAADPNLTRHRGPTRQGGGLGWTFITLPHVSLGWEMKGASL